MIDSEGILHVYICYVSHCFVLQKIAHFSCCEYVTLSFSSSFFIAIANAISCVCASVK